MNEGGELWVLSLLVDGSDCYWDERMTFVDTPEKLGSRFDLHRLPYGALLLKGRRAKRFLKQCFISELRWRREQKTKVQIGGPNRPEHGEK
jgi:hypothetical protein